MRIYLAGNMHTDWRYRVASAISGCEFLWPHKYPKDGGSRGKGADVFFPRDVTLLKSADLVFLRHPERGKKHRHGGGNRNGLRMEQTGGVGKSVSGDTQLQLPGEGRYHRVLHPGRWTGNSTVPHRRRTRSHPLNPTRRLLNSLVLGQRYTIECT